MTGGLEPIWRHLAIGISVPTLLLAAAFLVPEPYSHPIIYVGMAPTKLMPFLENRELMGELTVAVFGRMTPNYAPIALLFLIAFWFVVGVVGSFVFSKFKARND